MNAQEYAEKMKAHEQKFEELWVDIVADTNAFVESKDDSMYMNVNTFIESLCLSGAWISDRINGYSGVPGLTNYSKSLSKKIRKIFGYTF